MWIAHRDILWDTTIESCIKILQIIFHKNLCKNIPSITIIIITFTAIKFKLIKSLIYSIFYNIQKQLKSGFQLYIAVLQFLLSVSHEVWVSSV